MRPNPKILVNLNLFFVLSFFTNFLKKKPKKNKNPPPPPPPPSKLARKTSVDRFSLSLFSLTCHDSLNGWKKLLLVFIALLLISSCKKDKEEPQKVTSIAITPSPAGVAVGSTQQLKAIVGPADAANKEVAWSSSDPSKAAVDAAGLVTGVTAGAVTITSTAKDGSDVKGTATGTVTLKKVTSIAITPSPASVAAGSTQQLTAAVLPEDAADKGVTWSSSDETKATVNADGLVSGLTTGAVTITATAKDGSGVTGAIELTVTPKKVTSITITPLSPRVVVGDTRQLRAEVLPADAANKEVTWSSSDISKATVDAASGLARGVAEGTATITATAKDGSGVTGTTTLTVTLTRTLSASITITPSPAGVAVGSTQQLTANVLPEDATDKEVTWSSSDISKATVDANGLVTGLTEGRATVTATAKDGSRVTGAVELTVTPKKVTSIAVTSSLTSVAAGSTQQLTAVVLPADAAHKGATWSSGDISKATVDANGLVTGVAAGTVTITATAKDGSGVTGTIELTVTQRATSIVIAPAEPSVVGVGKTLALTATVSPSTASQTVTWTSSPTTIATVSSTGIVTGVTKGTAVITVAATDGSGVSVARTVTVKSSDVSIASMTLGAASTHVYSITPAAGGTVSLNNVNRTFAASIAAVPVTFTAADHAAVTKGGVAFASGSTADFSSPVTFTVTAEDGTTTAAYTVSITAYNAASNPYGIYTAVQLSDVRNSLASSYKLMNDIALPALGAAAATALGFNDYAAKGWKPLGNCNTGLTGTFDGNNHSISNLKIARSDEICVGLFGGTQGSGTIKNLGVVSVGISGNYIVGAIAGEARGLLVTHCSSAGNITAATDEGVGGIAGFLGAARQRGKVISNCYSSCEVTANSTTRGAIGALVGYSEGGIVINCYAAGRASVSSGNENLRQRPGLVGNNAQGSGTITTCYATGGNGLAYNAARENGVIIYQGTVNNSYYPSGQTLNTLSNGGTAMPAGAARANFVNFDFDNVWIWTDGQWPKFRNVPGTQPTVNLP